MPLEPSLSNTTSDDPLNAGTRVARGRVHGLLPWLPSLLAFALLGAVTIGVPTAAADECRPASTARRGSSAPLSLVVAPFNNLTGHAEHEWLTLGVPIALSSDLDKGEERGVSVFAPELFQIKMREWRTDPWSTAKRLRIRRFITGSFSAVGDDIRIDAFITDTETGMNEPQGSDFVEGSQRDVLALQKDLAVKMLTRLDVRLSALEKESRKEEINTDPDAFQLFLQVEGVIPPSAAGSAAPPPPAPPVESDRDASWFELRRVAPLIAWLLPAAYGQEVDGSLTAFFNEYARAHEERDIDKLGSLFVEFPAEQRQTLSSYLASVDDLTIEFRDIAVLAGDDGDLAVSYTRRDSFVDRRTRKQLLLEGRFTKVMRQGDDGRWQIHRSAPAQ